MNQPTEDSRRDASMASIISYLSDFNDDEEGGSSFREDGGGGGGGSGGRYLMSHDSFVSAAATEERLAEMSAKMDELLLRRDEERRSYESSMERLERRLVEAERRLEEAKKSARASIEASSTVATSVVPPDDVEGSSSTSSPSSTARVSELEAELRGARAQISILTSQLCEIQRRSDETQSTLEARLERALRDVFARKLDHAAQIAALRRELAETRREHEAEEWALAARQSFTLEMERDHRKDKLSLLRSRKDRELREKVELIENLREALAKRDRNIEVLTADLEDARAHIRKIGGMNRRGSALEGCSAPQESALFGRLHEALGVPAASSVVAPGGEAGAAPAVADAAAVDTNTPSAAVVGGDTSVGEISNAKVSSPAVPVPGEPIMNVASALGA